MISQGRKMRITIHSAEDRSNLIKRTNEGALKLLPSLKKLVNTIDQLDSDVKAELGIDEEVYETVYSLMLDLSSFQ